MTDQQRLADIWTTEKKLTENYDAFASDCVHLALRNELLKALARSHSTQTELLLTAQNRGWSRSEPAQQQRIQQVRTRFWAEQPV